MFGFGKKKEDPNRKAFREEFETVTQALRQADDLTQIAVGHAINMANSLFLQAYNTPSDFQKLPKAQQIEYINKLSNMEVGLSEEKMIHIHQWVSDYSKCGLAHFQKMTPSL